jgi:hypothetical protein
MARRKQPFADSTQYALFGAIAEVREQAIEGRSERVPTLSLQRGFEADPEAVVTQREKRIEYQLAKEIAAETGVKLYEARNMVTALIDALEKRGWSIIKTQLPYCIKCQAEVSLDVAEYRAKLPELIAAAEQLLPEGKAEAREYLKTHTWQEYEKWLYGEE